MSSGTAPTVGKRTTVPREWQLVELSEVLLQQQRAVAVEATEEYPLLGARWYAKGLYIKDTKPGSQIKADRLFRVEQGDFVYNRLFAWKGSFAVADSVTGGCYVSNEFPTFTVARGRLDPSFLWWYFSRQSAWNDALGVSYGATPTSRNRLKERDLLAMSVPLPPVHEQRRIAAKIDLLAARVAEAKWLRTRVLKHVSALTASLHFAAAASRRRKIGDLVRLSEHRQAVQPDAVYPQVGIRGFGGGLFGKRAIKGTETTYKHFNHLRTGQLVLSQVKGWEGAIGVCPPALSGYFASPEYRTFECITDECEPAYLDVIVRSDWFRKLLADATRGQGARRERTRPELLSEIEVAFPPVQEQRRLLRTFSRLNQISSLQKETSKEFDALLPSILDKAFKGEL